MEICPDCLEAKIFLIDLNKDFFKYERELIVAIDEEETRLKKENYFDQDNIGIFYSIFETRPYIRALYQLANHYAEAGKIC